MWSDGGMSDNTSGMGGSGSIDAHSDAAGGEAQHTDQVIDSIEHVEESIRTDEGPSRGTLRDVADSLGISSEIGRAHV